MFGYQSREDLDHKMFREVTQTYEVSFHIHTIYLILNGLMVLYKEAPYKRGGCL